MRCPVCDAKATHISYESKEHTRIHTYVCDLCKEQFSAFELYSSKPKDDMENMAINGAKVYRLEGGYKK